VTAAAPEVRAPVGPAARAWAAAAGPVSTERPPPLPPRVSKARPARLIWPKRTAETDQGTLVVLILSVDHDGFVTGVRLKGASPRRRDEQAADAAWKFRYDPARDHDGRPIASKVDQPVVVL
jgi:TonB family protein